MLEIHFDLLVAGLQHAIHIAFKKYQFVFNASPLVFFPGLSKTIVNLNGIQFAIKSDGVGPIK